MRKGYHLQPGCRECKFVFCDDFYSVDGEFYYYCEYKSKKPCRPCISNRASKKWQEWAKRRQVQENGMCGAFKLRKDKKR